MQSKCQSCTEFEFYQHTSSKDIENTIQKIKYGTTMTGFLAGIGFLVDGCTVYHF